MQRRLLFLATFVTLAGCSVAARAVPSPTIDEPRPLPSADAEERYRCATLERSLCSRWTSDVIAYYAGQEPPKKVTRLRFVLLCGAYSQRAHHVWFSDGTARFVVADCLIPDESWHSPPDATP